MSKGLLSSLVKPVFGMAPNNYTGAAGTNKYVSLKNNGHITIAIITGAWAGGTAAVTVNQASDTSGTGAKALALDFQYTTVAASDDTITQTAIASNTFNLSAANKVHIIEIEATQLDVSNGFNAVSVVIATPGSNADYYAVLYLLGEARYAQLSPPTVQ